MASRTTNQVENKPPLSLQNLLLDVTKIPTLFALRYVFFQRVLLMSQVCPLSAFLGKVSPEVPKLKWPKSDKDLIMTLEMCLASPKKSTG